MYDETVRGKLCREKKILENRIRFLKKEITGIDGCVSVENLAGNSDIVNDNTKINNDENYESSKMKKKDNEKRKSKNENEVSAVEIDCDSDNELEVEVVDDSDDEVNLFSFYNCIASVYSFILSFTISI